MPINPDGTVTLIGSDGSRKIVKPEELGNYGVSYQDYLAQKKAYDEVTGTAYKTEADSIMQGIIQPSDTTSIQTQKILQERGYKAPLTDDALKAQQQDQAGQTLRKNAISSIDDILGDRTSGMTGTLQLGTTPGIATKTKTTLAEYDKLKSLLTLENIKYLKGTGQISDKEQLILESAALEIPDSRQISDDDFRRILKETRAKLSVDLPEESTKQTKPEYTPKSPSDVAMGAYNKLYPEGGRDIVSDIVLGGGWLDLNKDVMASIQLKGKTGKELESAFNSTLDMANKALERADQEQDPVIKDRLTKIAFESMEQVSKEKGNIEKLFSERADSDIPTRALEVGLEAGSLVNYANAGTKLLYKVPSLLTKAAPEVASSALSKTPSLGAKIVNTVNKLNPVKYLSNKQTQEAAKISTKVAVDNILNAGKNMAVKSSADATALKNLMPSIKETETVTKLLENLRYWGEQAFTVSGAVKDKANARVASALYRAGVEELKTIAPEAYKYRRLLAYTFDLPKTTGKWLWRVLVAKGVFKGF